MAQRARLEWHGDEVTGYMRTGAAQGLTTAAEHILQVSRTQVPHEEGTLERSGVASVDSVNLTAAVSYDTPYAVRQHEELDYQHDAGRKPKYLEDPMNTEAATVRALIVAAIRRSLRG